MRDNSVLLVYSGARKGDFLITGGVSRTKYRVPGQGGIVELATNRVQGINPSDLNWFLSVNQGRDFKIVPKPQETEPAPAPAPKPAPQQAPAPAPQPVNVKAWEPEVMEAEPAPEIPLIDLQEMTVAEIRELDIDPDQLDALAEQERQGKNRKTVLDILGA